VNEPIPTLLQIDLQNLFYGARNLGQRIDLEKVWDFFRERETEFLSEALVYMIRGDDFDSTKFETKLKAIGYSLRIKHAIKMVKDSKVSYRQSNHDVGITVDCMDKIDVFKKWILMSGDGDFVDLCKYLKSKGRKIEIWGFKECHNPQLEPYADKMYFIDESFYLKKSRISVFGFNSLGAI
jgi:uncharacterized LabA/DUF88 family protein